MANWLPVPGYESYYSVSDEGEVRSEDRIVAHIRDGKKRKGQIVKARINKQTGYPSLNLSFQGRMKTFTVHKLVCLAFLGPRPINMEVCHIDGDRSNAKLTNLRYGTSKENTSDMVKHGTMARGEKLTKTGLKDNDIRNIRKDQRLQRVIAQEYNVSPACISNIQTKISWRHIED